MHNSIQKTLPFQRFVFWKRVKVAPSNKTNKKSNTRGLECPLPIGAPQEEPQEAPKWGPRASREEPCGVQKSFNNQCVSTIRGLAASQGGTKQQDQQEEQQEGPKGPMARSDPPSLGLGASLGDPKGL